MSKRKTAGELSIKALSDTARIDPLEVGWALTEDVFDNLMECALRHEKIFDEEEYFIIFIIAGDPLISNLRRHKYTAFLFLPQPRPQQCVFLYNKITKDLKRLWCMPDAKVMATISEMAYVSPEWRNTKGWADAFFRGDFFNHIRKQHDIKHLSESEYLDANREELIKALGKNKRPVSSDAFDFSKISTYKIVDSANSISDKS